MLKDERYYGRKDYVRRISPPVALPHAMIRFQIPAAHSPDGAFAQFIQLYGYTSTYKRYLEERLSFDQLNKELDNLFGSEGFWQNIVEDLTLFNGGLAENFFEYFHPLDNPTGKYEGGHGKYAMYDYATRMAKDTTLNEFVSFAFKPPLDNPSLTPLVNRSRRLMLKFSSYDTPELARRRREYVLADPYFWRDFGDYLTTVPKDTNFHIALKEFNTIRAAHPDASWKARGEGQDVYDYLKNQATYSLKSWSEEKKKRWERLKQTLPFKQRITTFFHDAAPLEIKLALRAQFPDDFAPLTLEEIEHILDMPKDIESILQTLSLLRTDNQAHVIDTFAQYIELRQQQKGVFLPEGLARNMLQHAVDTLGRNSSEEHSPTLTTITDDAAKIIDLIANTPADSPLPTDAARAFATATHAAYFVPLLKSLISGPAALFWNNFHHAHPNSLVSPSQLTEFIAQHATRELTAQKDSVREDAAAYIRDRVLPEVLHRINGIAQEAPTIAYFTTQASDGSRKFLFMHQVEAIKQLSEQKGGILADEAGLGKTIELALAALRIIDAKNITHRPARVLVVGTKSVLDNWEQELATHIDQNAIDTVNFTFSQDPRQSPTPYSFQRRVRMLTERLQNPARNKQFVLVNYDVFRHQSVQRLLKTSDIDVIIVDEAHNVKSGVLAAITRITHSDGAKTVARRTRGLYRFIHESEDAAIFIATGTPYVKKLTEPLILGHMVDRNRFPAERIAVLKNDVVGTNRALREVMIRNRKKDIADLPPKKTEYIPLDLGQMSQEEQEHFLQEAHAIAAKYDTPSALFYALLNLEVQAKIPWIIEKVRDLNSQDRRVFIVTPFVRDERVHTKDISTHALWKRLQEAGVASAEILDGTLSGMERLDVQRRFKEPNGTVNIVGNFAVAGESLTLCSPTNRATEVILVAGPNSISRFLQAVNRVHRIGQPHAVTVHVPVVTGDLLNRPGGTYDEQILRRLLEETRSFEATIDGLFFQEPPDIYKTVAQKARYALKKGTVFVPKTPLSSSPDSTPVTRSPIGTPSREVTLFSSPAKSDENAEKPWRSATDEIVRPNLNSSRTPVFSAANPTAMAAVTAVKAPVIPWMSKVIPSITENQLTDMTLWDSTRISEVLASPRTLHELPDHIRRVCLFIDLVISKDPNASKVLDLKTVPISTNGLRLVLHLLRRDENARNLYRVFRAIGNKEFKE